MKLSDHLRNLFCGIVTGSSMLLPGISGGTTAIIIGIYDKLISAVSGFFTAPKKHAVFLLEVCIGGMLGILFLAKAVLSLTQSFYMPMHYLFMGLIAGSVPLLVKSSEMTVKKIPCIIFAFIGTALAAGVSFLPQMSDIQNQNIIMLFTAGIMIAAALILPGISTSHMLLSTGMYEPVLKAVSNADIPYLIPIIIGTLSGILLLTKLLGYALIRFKTQSYMLITGFVAASVYSIYPGMAHGKDTFICFGMFISGFMLLSFISLKVKNEKNIGLTA